MDTLAIVSVGLVAVVGIALAMAGLPGTWLIVLAAMLAELWRGDLFGWWAIGACIGLAVLAEIIEFVAGAAGASTAGGGKRSWVGAIIGAIVGAVMGTPIVPVLGTILGGVLGAGLGAGLAEWTRDGRSFGDVVRVGQGAAVGRAISVIGKTLCALGIVVALAAGLAWG